MRHVDRSLLKPAHTVANYPHGRGNYVGDRVDKVHEAAAKARTLGPGSLGFRFKETQENINQMQGDNWGDVNTDWVLDNIRNYC